jgi:hypothetical protein
MHQRSAHEASEDRFRKFSSELLAAEEVGFRDDFFYSPDALRKILVRFCDIIAENLHVQSCTVQLKLYDSLNSPLLKQLLESKGELLESKEIEVPEDCKGDARRLWTNFSEQCKQRCDAVVSNNYTFSHEQIKFRQELLKNSIIFPYALYPKGALWLVASNEKSPWADCAPWLISDINRGVMTQIVQDKAARVRDRMSIRQTRSHRKLGPTDPYIWTNQFVSDPRQEDQASPRYFFNYYGVPIRIHQGGDVIGILRVENKGLGAVKSKDLDEPHALAHKLLGRVMDLALTETTNADELAGRLHESLLACKEEIALTAAFVPSNVSLLSLVYLAHDLASTRDKHNQTVRDLCTLPYDTADDAQTIASGVPDVRGLPGVDSRAPVQMTFDSSEEECGFVDWLSGTNKDSSEVSRGGASRDSQRGSGGGLVEPPHSKEVEKHRFEAVKTFYATLTKSLSLPLSKEVELHIEDSLEEAIAAVRELTGIPLGSTRCKAERVSPGRSLLCAIRLEVPGERRFFFHVQVTPSQSEVTQKELSAWWGLSPQSATHYCEVNREGHTPDPDDREFHLPTDRLAARIEALTFAFPIPKFTINDAWWLSWAALEIGKLIERQISYRGTNLTPTVPLTAMDFFRVPISDLSFVDALRAQYKAAEAVQNMLQYYLPNHCRELNLDAKLEHHSRIKDFRSYLERVGQEHRAHYDALISTWLYLLFLRLGNTTAANLRERLIAHRERCSSPYIPEELVGHFSNLEQCELLYDQAIALLEDLGTFHQAIEALCENESVLFTDKLQNWFRENGDKILGDLKFAAPKVRLSDDKRSEALKLLFKNLSDSPQAASDPRSSGMKEREIGEYVFRRYDPFVTQGISLYITLTNTERFNEDKTLRRSDDDEDKNSYEIFYDECRKLTGFLRKKFESSHQLHERYRKMPKDSAAMKRKELIEILERWRTRAFSLSTTNFSSVLNTAGIEPGEDDVHLNIRGIYKRIRTLVNIASNQVSPSLLNWETSRFDYVGARVNCLFKTQVFAIYEHLWNRGDPFSHWTSSQPEGGLPSPESEYARQRWLSVRTKIHEGEDGYYAWQILALVDPRAVEKGHWKRIYTINAVRDYLVLSFEDWHRGPAGAYRKLAVQRNQWQEDYCKWFRNIRNILRGERPSREKDQDIYFPDYLLRTPCDIFIRLLETQEARESDFQAILTDLLEFIRTCREDDRPSQLRDVAGRIYDKAKELAQEKGRNDAELENALQGQLPVLEKERVRFGLDEQRAQSGAHSEKWPDRQAFGEESLEDRLKELQRLLNADVKGGEIWRKALQHILIGVQSMQKQYLFKMGKARETHNVLDRILCYVLLFDRERKGDKFKEWSAHDLFYYLMSLVPAEIQIRTALANTMAEQYHGLYKSSAGPTSDVAVQQWRLQKIGRKLDDVDRETEAQYDEYIDHSMLHDEGPSTREE